MQSPAAASVLEADVDVSGFSLEDFPRLRRLREALLSAEKSICIERARIVTEFFRREGFDEARPVLRQARALRAVLEEIPPVVFDEELIVGSTTTHRLGNRRPARLLLYWEELLRLGSSLASTCFLAFWAVFRDELPMLSPF